MAEPGLTSATTNADVITPIPTTPQKRPSDFRDAMDALNNQLRSQPASSRPRQPEAPARGANGMLEGVRGAVDATGGQPAPRRDMQEPIATPPAQKPQPLEQTRMEAQQPELAELPTSNEPAKQEAPPTDLEDLERYRKWKTTPELDDELLDKLVLMKDGDREEYVTVRDARGHHMRHSKFTAKMTELAGVEEQLGHREQRMQQRDQMFNDLHAHISNPATVHEAFKRMGLSKVFHEAVENYATQLREYESKHGPGSFDRLLDKWERTTVETRMQRLARENAELRQRLQAPQQQQPNVAPDVELANRQLEQLQPRAFQARNLPIGEDPKTGKPMPGSEFCERLFMSQLGQLMRAEKTTKVTPSLVESAAEATAEIYWDGAASAREGVRAKQLERARGANGHGSSTSQHGGQPGARRPQDQPATHGNFRDHIASVNGGRAPWSM